MLLKILIVSTLPWFPNPLSAFGLGLLALAALFSRLPGLALLSAVVWVQDARISQAVADLWAENRPSVQCRGEVQVVRVLSVTEAYSRFEADWLASDCPEILASDRFPVSIQGVEALAVGDRFVGSFVIKPISAFVNPHGFDARRHALGESWNYRATVTQWNQVTTTSLRAQLYHRVAAWPDPLSGLALALVFGEKQSLQPDLKLLFEQLGLAHLLAISGLHVGVVLGGLWWGLKRIPGPRDPRMKLLLRTGVMAFAGWGLADWTLYSPSVIRASVMAVVLSAWPLFFVRSSLAGALAVTLGLILIMDPLASLSTGLLMSAGAVMLIAVLHWAWPLTGWVGLIRLQLGFSAVMAPVLSVASGFTYPWLGLLANLCVVPLLPLVLVALIGLTLYPWQEVIEAVSTGLFWVTAWVGEALSLTLFADPVSHLLLWTLIGWGAIQCLPFTWPRITLWAVFALCLWGLMGSSHPSLIVHDVGQGSAATLRVDREQVVFDLAAGQPDGWSRVSQFIRTLDLTEALALSISHADMDHIGGLHTLLNSAPIPERVEGGGTLDGLMAPCEARRVGAVHIEVLWPTGVLFKADENHRSCVHLIRTKRMTVLLMGDADWVTEAWVVRALADRGLLGQVDAVVVSHHGARDGSSPSFVEAVGAQWALISVGAQNRYGHPHPEVVERWRRAGTRVMRTDTQGALWIDLMRGSVWDERTRRPTRWTQLGGHRPDTAFDRLIRGSLVGD